jgi:hypothetical protein
MMQENDAVLSSFETKDAKGGSRVGSVVVKMANNQAFYTIPRYY